VPQATESRTASKDIQVLVGLASCGVAAGAAQVNEALIEALSPYDVPVKGTGCIGMCHAEPLVEIIDAQGKHYMYGKVTADRAKKIVESHVLLGQPVDEWLIIGGGACEGEKYLEKQKRIVLRNCGHIDPESIEDYIAAGGYKAIEKALKMTPEQVIEEVLKSGLRGRGGAGFPTGMKWQLTRQVPGENKFIVCNADEGDPGAFMDRSVLESDPHSVIEGMLIGSYALGARQGFIYCRAEYPVAVKRLKRAVAMATEFGYLGKNVCGSNHDFELTIREGAGAFVCGEETALLMSIEGRRGMPVPRPPFPSEKGLWQSPTSINNVETFANVPWIIDNGSEAFASLGTAKSKGTKVFALAGMVVKGGLVEVPMGTTIREIVYDIGGGIRDGHALKAVQTGGPSGGCIPAALQDTPVDYDSLAQVGSIMGSGGLLVMDDTACMVDVARYFMGFCVEESCGKCTFCRVGTRQMHEILERICGGEGKMEDLDKLEEIAAKVKKGSLCGLGQSAPNPVLTTLKNFRDEYITHIVDKKCPAKRCVALIRYDIDEAACTGCTLCSRNCPAGAITGTVRKPHVIDQSKCIKCGLCSNVCKFHAVAVS
jgi:NADH-quinone oxidoreductase subunit F